MGRTRGRPCDSRQQLLILHDFERWANFETVKEVEGFKIARAV